MPEYQYKCKNCGKDFTIVRPMGSNATTPCPECKSNNIARQYTSVPSIYKTNGFYNTDMKAKKDAANNLKDLTNE